jgi:hypothetical protein
MFYIPSDQKTLVTNIAPVLGECYIIPRSAEAFTTDITAACSGWIDPHEPLSYTYKYLRELRPSLAPLFVDI